MADQHDIVGGGTKKLLYAADTILRMGVGKSAKAQIGRAHV